MNRSAQVYLCPTGFEPATFRETATKAQIHVFHTRGSHPRPFQHIQANPVPQPHPKRQSNT
jgi:hypothetical protein